MERIWCLFTTKKELSYLILAGLVIFGFAAAGTIQRESAPEVQIPIAIVSSALPGASPEDVETLIVEELEKAVADIDNVKEITSTSREGVGSVVVEFEADADLDESIDKVKDEVDLVRGDLPDDATTPIVSEVNFADQPIVIASIVSDLPVTEFKKLADDLTEDIEGIQGVARAEVTGVRDREVTVVVRKEDLALHNLTLDSVVRSIQTSDVALPVGTLEVDGVEYAIEFEGRIDETGAVVDIPIVTPAGTVLRLSDIALVADGVEDYTTISRVSVDAEPPIQAATLLIYKQRGADITRVSRDVSELIADLDAQDSSEAKIVVTYDAGEQIITDLTTLTKTGLQTVGLVLLLLLLALGWREAIIASLSIPLSFLTALMVMQATGNTINFISLFSLILSIGILVDTAIVMTEAIHTNKKAGIANTNAAKKAIKEFHYPVTTGILTTIAVFAPLFTISGITGEFIASIPFTVIAVLVSSLVISLAFIPLIASTFLHRKSAGHMEEIQEEYTAKLRDWYRSHIPMLLDHKKRKRRFVLGLTSLLIILMALPFFGVIKVAFFPQSDVDFLYVNLEEPQGTPLERTDLAVRTIEDVLMEIPEIESYTTTVGAGSAFDENPQSGPRFASVTVNLNKERERTSTEIVQDVEERLRPYNDLDVRVLQPTEGPPTGAPVLITFYGEDLGELKLLANDAADLLRGIEGTRAVTSSGQDDASEFSLTIDRRAAAELGLSPAQVAGTLRTAVFGTEAITIKQGGEEIDVIVKLNLNRDYQTAHDTNRTTVDTLYELPIETSRGTVLLGSVLSTSLEASSDSIRREDERRIATASSQVEEGVVAREVSTIFEERFNEEIDLPDGATMRIGGETEDVDQSFRDMFRALGIAMVLVLAVLVVQFNSYRQAFIVLSVVPLSLIGVLVGLLVTQEYLSFPSMLGFIALSGIVVNNAIILVDVWNRMRRDKPELPLRTVVIEGAALRLRPILLTTFTTIIGIAPLIFASDLWRPIAIAIMFGLLFAVVLTLMLVPALYLKFCKKPLAHLEPETYKNGGNARLLVVLLIAVGSLLPIGAAHAFSYTNGNIQYAYHEAPTSFELDEHGQAFGQTVSGFAFRQLNVANDYDIRLQRFEIGTAYWYISDQGVIWADNDLTALSIYLSRIA